MEEMSDLFISMGWEIGEGPELEHEWFNFDALNFDEDHPARALQDTFFVEPVDRHLVMRTHTSPVQIRSLLTRPLPVYVAAVGRVYRTDELDATHTPVFHQIEGIAIDKDLTMAHLRGTLEHLARAMFGAGAQIRLRPTTSRSPSRAPRWTSGSPTPRAARAGSSGAVAAWSTRTCCARPASTPTSNQGFAFGMGIERTLQFRNDMNDMRDMVEGDVRFSQQFGMVV
jgi:phenylalanyl-tRNA synthetase alpha chain